MPAANWFIPTGGYGFIVPEDSAKDAFLHIFAVERAGLGTLLQARRVLSELRPGPGGRVSAEDQPPPTGTISSAPPE